MRAPGQPQRCCWMRSRCREIVVSRRSPQPPTPRRRRSHLVCTGAADGYARRAGKPATTVLHLGLGLANGGWRRRVARCPCTRLRLDRSRRSGAVVCSKRPGQQVALGPRL
jgi:hypothetical protein